MLSTEYATGSPCWLDLASPDPAGAAAFYGAVLGWSLAPAPQGDHGLLQHQGRTAAALGPLAEPGARSAWTLAFKTPDADATAQAAEELGATVRIEAYDVPGAGRTARLADPGGAQFALWQPAAVEGLEAVGEEGALCWTELFSPDPAAAAAFYRRLFGWHTEEVTMLDIPYTLLATAGGDRSEAAFGGIAPLQDSAHTPRWLPYFEAADVDAAVGAARAGGGSVLTPAFDAPGVGRMAALADPYGAPFAVTASAAAAAG
ncbi:VOC family protein [Streptomyces sp. NPDC051907]|uniref:VOC family protein n=1 Tax=Streptomyces sp. NPDC051907 TaxID=3155284 RepID=UPI003430D734